MVANKDRMDDAVCAQYTIGEPNNEIAGTPVWLGWTQTASQRGRFDYTLLAAFESDGTYYFVRQSIGADAVFLGAIETILGTYWTVRDDTVID